MKIQVLSDLHREVADRNPKIFGEKFEPVGDVVVLAGDIASAVTRESVTREFGNCEKPVLFVAGNHDYYRGDWETEIESMRKDYEFEGSAIKVLENQHIKIGDVHFLGCTFWPKIDPVLSLTVAASIADFRAIKNITVNKVVEAHARSYEWLDDTLSNLRLVDPTCKIVVITHFPPSLRAQEEKFKNSNLTSYFYNDCDELIFAHRPDVWIYGHTHGHIRWKDGDTKVVCNQYGYRGYETNPEFDPNFIVEV